MKVNTLKLRNIRSYEDEEIDFGEGTTLIHGDNGAGKSTFAQAVAEYLVDHPAVHTVNYPGLSSHPQHELAMEQMNGFGGVVSFELDATEAETRSVLEELEVFTIAVSLGGVESLVDHPWSMSASFVSPETRRSAGISESLVRAPVGIENSEDLIRDLDQALANL